MTDLASGLLIALVVAALSVVAWIVRRAVARLDTRFDRIESRLDTGDAQVVELRLQVATVSAQHQNNGGSTMRDAVDRIERNGRALTQTVDGIRTDLNAHLIESAGDHARLDDHLRKGDG